MSELAVTNNTIKWAIKKGTSASIALNKTDGWDMYDEIRMDLKPSNDIAAYSSLRLTVGSGLTIDNNRLIISLTYQQTTALPAKQLFADIKLRIGTEVIAPIPFLITIKDTVTKLP